LKPSLALNRERRPLGREMGRQGPGMTRRAVKGQPPSLRELWAAQRLIRKIVEEMGRPTGPPDPNHLAKRIADIATGEMEDVVRCVKKESR
jgi:hypothetical protein